MNARRWKEIQTAFDGLVAMDIAARSRHLTVVASSDPELHRALESLLAADVDVAARLATIDSALAPEVSRPADPLGLAGRAISHFAVHQALGAGGMGVVYRADDTRLHRAVALKFLLPHYGLDPSAKVRFLREAHTAATLDHPNLCTVYEAGTTDEGWLFLAMALYEGETLRARLTRDGALAVSEALEIARQLAEGLQAAHAAGIVHRDLKPSNIMLVPGGAVRILDFGLAKARDQSLTETGAHFGTVSYMSPAQVRGEAVDGRADLWALGVVLYEMLTGRKPFDGTEDLAIAHAILHEAPELPSVLRHDLPGAVEALVLRLLQKDSAKRHATAEELLRGIARLQTLPNGGVDGLRMRWRHARRFVTGGRGPAKRQLLFVVACLTLLAAAYGYRSTVLHARTGPTMRARAPENQAAHDLYVQGRFFFEKKDSASFVKAQDYFRRAIQSDSLYAGAYSGLADAYSQQATYGFAPLASNFAKAKEYASRALALDSTLAEVHVSLGFIALFYEWNWARAGRELETALRLDDKHASAHLFRAWYYVATDSADASIAEARRAVEIEQYSPLNNVRLVDFLFYGGRYVEALGRGRAIFERDSNFSTVRQELARVYLALGRCPEALRMIEPSVDLYVAALGGTRGYTYAKCGRRAQAVAELESMNARVRNGHASHYPLAVIQAGLGDTDQAIAELERAYTEHVWAMYMIRADPAFAELRSDPRFVAIVRRMHFGA